MDLGINSKRIIFILLTIIIVVNTMSTSASITFPEDNNSFIIDAVDVLNDNEELEINDISKDLNDYWGTELVLIVINSTNSYENDTNSSALSLKDYGRELFNEWDIGDKEWQDGILVILAINQTDNWEWSLEAGIFWDNYLDFNNIGLSADVELDNGNYFQAVKIIAEEIVFDVDNFWYENDGYVEPPVSDINIPDGDLMASESSGSTLINALVFIPIIIIIFVMIGISMFKGGSSNRGFSSGPRWFNRSNYNGYNEQHVYHHHDSNGPNDTQRKISPKISRRPGGTSRRSSTTSRGSVSKASRAGGSGAGRRGGSSRGGRKRK